MASINFLYRSKKANAPLTLRLLFRFKDKDIVLGCDSRYSIYTREEIIESPKLNAKEYWQKYHFQKRAKDINIINRQVQVQNDLNRIENFVLGKFEKTNIEQIDKEWLENVIDNYYNPKNINADIPITLVDYFDYYFKQRKLKKNSLQNLTTVKNKVEKLSPNNKIFISDIDDNFKERYLQFYSDYSYNTIIDDLRRIKTICKHAQDKGIEINKDVLKWQIKTDDTLFIYLSEKELEILENKKDLPEYLENAKEWLLISCYTAQRVSDFMRLDMSMIREEKNSFGEKVSMIEFKQVKTVKNIVLPLHSKVIELIKKNNNNFPRQISEQKYNDYIKEVCKKCGITEKVYGSKKNPKTNRKEIGYFEKWELVTSHIGRRTFANNYFGKIPTSLIMCATGHSTEKTFLEYINKSATEQAKQLADYF